MFLYRRSIAPGRSPGARKVLVHVLPWIFILGVAAGALLPAGRWADWLAPLTKSKEQLQRERDSEMLWRNAGNASVRHAAEVLRTIDGDTFDARVRVWPNLTLRTRVRLRGVDAPEIKAACDDEQLKAEAATRALRALLGEGGVQIFNVGPDKYGERVVADVATRRTPDVAAALVSAGHARPYSSGRRRGWC